MPANSQSSTRELPDSPNLRHLKDQAKDLLQSGDAKTLAEAQFKIARLYGFASWPKLKAHVESLKEVGQLKQAIDTNDLDRVKSLMTRNPALHKAPLGYAKNGPLTWVAECRVPWGPPSPERLEIARWMIENGSDVHQGGDGPLARAALNADRIPMMELLVRYGADVNAHWNGNFPIIFSPCEAVDAAALRWLVGHGADPNCGSQPGSETALDYVIGSYWRSGELSECIDILLEAGGVTRYAEPSVLDLLRGRLDGLRLRIDADPSIIDRRFSELDFGTTGERMLTLKGGTLLHVAVEYCGLDAARLLIERGADVNARASIFESGIGGQTPIFHSATQFGDRGLPLTEFLLARGADLSLRVKLPGHYERPDEVVECTPLGYAMRFPSVNERTVALLRSHRAPE